MPAAVMASLSCGIVSQPKMLRGGRLIVTRQYAGITALENLFSRRGVAHLLVANRRSGLKAPLDFIVAGLVDTPYLPSSKPNISQSVTFPSFHSVDRYLS